MKNDTAASKWAAITDHLLKAFENSNAPYITDICRLSKSDWAAANISWWVEGIFEILEELINANYVKDENAEYLLQAIALMED